MIVIPTFSDPFYEIVTAIEGVDYILDFRYNQREDCWYVDIKTIDDEDLAKGLKLVCNWPLLHQLHYETRLPTGELMVTTDTNDDSPPGLEDMVEDGRCRLVYLTAEELA